MRGRWLHLPLFFLAGLAFTYPAPLAEAQCADLLSSFNGGSTAKLNFVYPTNSGAIWNQLGAGLNLWNSTCGDQIPEMSRSTSPLAGVPNITVIYLTNGVACNGRTDACGCADIDHDASGEVSGGQLEIYENNANGDYCDPGVHTYAHEAGHFLGLDNVFSSSCQSNVMYHTTGAGFGITSEQCSLLDAMWEVPGEDPCDDPDPPQGCDGYEEGPGSPILIDFDRNGLALTDGLGGVIFDLDADGLLESISWTSPGYLDGFLWMDRNGNGRVDNGAEFFGDSTPLADGTTAEHGFRALAEFDRQSFGGDEDGFIAPGDEVFRSLRIWIDADHDGRSQASEIFDLVATGVVRIDLKMRTVGRRDSFGNRLRYKSKVWLSDGERELPTWATDVYFVWP